MSTISRLRNAIVLGGLLALSGCGGGPAPAPNAAVAPSPTAAQALSPTSAPTAVPTPVVNDPVVSEPLPVGPGDQIGISVSVSGSPGVPITYEWLDSQGKGKILDGQGSSGITYQAPIEPGTYKIEVRITAAGATLPKNVFVVVKEKPTDLPAATQVVTSSPPSVAPNPVPTQVDAVRADQPPTIDGRLDDPAWAQVQPFTYAVHSRPVNGSTAASVRLLWDDEYLYAAFDVNDTQVEGSNDATPYDGDSVALIIDNGGKIREYRYSVPDDRAGAEAQIEHVFKAETTPNVPDKPDQGYTVEMKIPWATSHAAGDTIAADLFSIDHDKNPGMPFDDPGTIFSKISWDGDQDVNTAKWSLRLSTSTQGNEPPPATATSGAVTLTSLHNDQIVPCENLAEGTYDSEITDPIWPVILIGNRYHPQDEGGKASAKTEGKWFGTVRFGDCNLRPDTNIGKKFQLLIISAGERCNKAFEDYIANGQATGKWPGILHLSDDCKEHVRIVVTRE